MLFNYNVIDKQGKAATGQIEAQSSDIAIAALQRRGYAVASVVPVRTASKGLGGVVLFENIPNREIVMMSRQLSAMFEAQVSAVKALSVVTDNAENALLKRSLEQLTNDVKSGVPISQAMKKHPKVFSDFYINMVRAGEESGRLSEVFVYLSDYLERTYELNSKTRNALIYPIFVIIVFILVMILMLTLVIPNLSEVILEAGGELPIYTRVVLAISDFFVKFGVPLLIAAIVLGFFGWRWSKGDSGRERLDRFKTNMPYVGKLYQKIALSRMANNLGTMLTAGIPVVRALEITANVVNNRVYHRVITQSLGEVRSGSFISDAFEKHSEIPSIMTQMVRVGEETGSMAKILGMLSKFYDREVRNQVDTLIGLIEPLMIIVLGLGVGFLLMSILVPMYSLTSTI